MPEIRRWFADTVNGSIPVDDICSDLIDTPAFQRLRRIKQLSLMDYVFAGAEHSRFNHSIGVMYNAVRMAEGLQLSRKEAKEIAVAALLHDIGHYPFSHLGEWAYQAVEDSLEATNKDDPVAGLDAIPPENFLWPFGSKPKINKEFHESFGARIVTSNKAIAGVLYSKEIDPEHIANLIRGSSENVICNQILHSNLDADRLDYLVRDSRQSGVTYGHVDKDYLIRMLDRGQQEFEGIGNRTIVKDVMCINQKGIHALEHFVLARYFHYSQVVYHKTVAAFEVLAKALIAQLTRRENGDRPVGALPRNHMEVEEQAHDDEFLTNRFVDSSIVRLLHKYRDELRTDKSLHEHSEDLAHLITCLLERRRPKTIFERAALIRKGEHDGSEVKKLEELLKRPGICKGARRPAGGACEFCRTVLSGNWT